jgi:hypothetical protein
LSMRMERLERQLMARSPVVSEGSGGRLIAASPETIRGLTVKQGALRTRYHGQNSPRVLLNLVIVLDITLKYIFAKLDSLTKPRSSWQTIRITIASEMFC